MSDPIRQRVVVRGQVQGVFFRDTCRREARAAHVSGFVRNEPDGTVLAVFEGDPDGVRRMVSWCRSGPPSAQVSDVEVTDEQPTGETGFAMR
jgi:acylphosphatase